MLGFRSQEDVDKPLEKLLIDADTGKTSPLAAIDPAIDALTHLPTDRSDVVGFDVGRAAKMIATATDVRRFDAKSKKWEVVATLAWRHEAGRAVFLDEHRVLVLGGVEKEHAVAEVCVF